jgi:hypothetical protein
MVWRRPDETRLYSTLLMVSHPESCLFLLIINNMIFCLIDTAIKKRDPLVRYISKNATPPVNTKSSLEIFFHSNIIIIIIKLF